MPSVVGSVFALNTVYLSVAIVMAGFKSRAALQVETLLFDANSSESLY